MAMRDTTDPCWRINVPTAQELLLQAECQTPPGQTVPRSPHRLSLPKQRSWKGMSLDWVFPRWSCQTKSLPGEDSPRPFFICLGTNPASATINSRAPLELVDKSRAPHVPRHHSCCGTLLSESFWPISDWTM